MLDWIYTLLTNRKQFVSTNDFPSRFEFFRSPTRTELGSLLFLIHLNGLPDSVFHHIRLLVDNCVVYRNITSTSEQDTLESDLNPVESWCERWLMPPNANECKIDS